MFASFSEAAEAPYAGSRTKMGNWSPVQREEETVLRRQSESVRDLGLVTSALNAMSELVMVLNSQHQIVFANESLLRFLRQNDAQALLGIRPGEAFHCVRAGETPSGCGSSQFCDTCGANQALLAGRAGQSDVQEYRIVRNDQADALDLRVKTTPLIIAGETFTICALADISHEKRRRLLEKIFFHDILNMAVGLKLLLGGLSNAGPGEARVIRKMTEEALERILDGIATQRDLTAAENNELILHPKRFKSLTFLRQLTLLHTQNNSREVTVVLDPAAQEFFLNTDKTVFARVVGNMLENALEASRSGETVSVGCRRTGERVAFWVHNRSPMAPAIQGQIFQRSFSTKGDGRGLGTYSMKLLTERYLRGTVSFTSAEEAGTTFTVEIPVQLKTVDI
jgi:signal transduction histidine kinase